MGHFLGFLIVESCCADTTSKEVSHLVSETTLVLKEDDGFVLEPLDAAGQNVTSFLLNVCINKFMLTLLFSILEFSSLPKQYSVSCGHITNPWLSFLFTVYILIQRLKD